METLYVRMTRAKLMSILNNIPHAATQGGPADPILIGAGNAALGRIELAFLVKSWRGTDETGERWAALSERTIAKRIRKRDGTKETDRPSPHLTPTQREQWWNFYRSALMKYKEKDIAARVAWSRLKRRGGVKLFNKYARQSIDILKDTGQLLESLTPNAQSSSKIFRVSPGKIEVGSNRKGAAAHHHGVPGKLPQRRLWAHPTKWPSSWWIDILDAAREGVIQLIAEELKT